MNWAELAWQAVNRQHAQQRLPELAAALQHAAGYLPGGGEGVVVEIGCGAGGTLYCWRQLAGDVFGVTENVPGPQFVISHGATLIWGDSHDRATFDALARLLPRAADVLFIDGDHSYDGALADWITYSPLVRDRGLVLMHDVLHTDLCPGVAKAWEQICSHLPAGTCQILDGYSYDDPENHPAGFGAIQIRS